MRYVLVLFLLLVSFGMMPGFGQSLSGTWSTDVELDIQQSSFWEAISLDSILTISMMLDGWTFGSVTALDKDGWIDQDFSASGILGGFSASTALDLNPNATFGSWVMSLQAPLWGVLLGSELRLESSDVSLTLTSLGDAGEFLSINVSVQLGNLTDNTCDLDFQSALIGANFDFCECAPIQATINFTCAGFEYLDFTTTGISLPNLSWLTLAGTLRFTLAAQSDSKILTLSPTISFGNAVCFDLYSSVITTGNLTLGDITIDGIGLTCNFGDISFRGLSYWGNGAKPSPLTSEYWEIYTISASNAACCGPLDFDISALFKQGGLSLFDLALIDVNISLTVSPSIVFRTEVTIDIENGSFTEWVLGFLVTW